MIPTERFEIDGDKEANYRRLVRPRKMDQLKEEIQTKLIHEKKYRVGDYTARKLAEELHTNVRYISAVIRVHHHTNYNTFVNRLRVEEAMMLLTDPRYAELNVEEIGNMVGFLHRQSFHSAFQKFVGTSPHAYREKYGRK